MKCLFWISEDGQGSVPMGEYESEAAAWDAQPAMKAELLDLALDDDEDYTGLMTKAAVRAGSWSVDG